MKIILHCPIATNVTEFSETWRQRRSESDVTVGKQRDVGGWLQRGGRSQKIKPLTDEPLGNTYLTVSVILSPFFLFPRERDHMNLMELPSKWAQLH